MFCFNSLHFYVWCFFSPLFVTKWILRILDSHIVLMHVTLKESLKCRNCYYSKFKAAKQNKTKHIAFSKQITRHVTGNILFWLLIWQTNYFSKTFWALFPLFRDKNIYSQEQYSLLSLPLIVLFGEICLIILNLIYLFDKEKQKNTFCYS